LEENRRVWRKTATGKKIVETEPAASPQAKTRFLLAPERQRSFSRGLPFMQKYRTYLIVGAPGSGKGTQGKILGSIPRFFHCACGDVFRGLDTRTPLGQAFVEYSSRGELVPDDLTVQLWRARIADLVGAHTFKPDIDSLVLDGIPRNVGQAKIMEEIIDVRKVFHLSCPDRSALVTRLRKRALKDNRFDDASEEVIRRRLETYDHESKPILEYYGPALIREIDATQPPVKVAYEILDTIIKEAKAQ
jgi:adenylate kinase